MSTYDVTGRYEGDDVVVQFPSGRQIEGRVVRWLGGTVVVLPDDDHRYKHYPQSWVFPHGSEPSS